MKLSDLTPEQWYGRLRARIALQRAAALKWWQYMDLEQPLVYVARILAEQDSRFPPLLLPWADIAIGSVGERLKFEAFLLADETPADDLNTWWQTNDADELADEAQNAAMVSGQHFLMVGPGDGDQPLLTFEYEDQVAVEIDPRTRQPIVSLKIWEDDPDFGGEQRAALILPDGRTFEYVNGEVETEGRLGDWSRVLREDPSMPSVPVLPMINRPRRGRGYSDLVHLKPILDAGNQFATNMMATGEHHAAPRKWAVGVSPQDFVDENGKQIPLWKVALGDVWAVPHQTPTARDQDIPEVKLGQFSASDLTNFHNTLKVLATTMGSTYGLPPHYIGYSSDNPPSAESIYFSMERLVLRAERRQGWDGYAYKKAARIAWTILGNDPADLVGMEAKWRDASTPTMASAMDAATKGLASGAIDNEQAWIILRLSEQTKKRLRKSFGERSITAAQSLREFDRTDVPAEVPSAPALRS